MDEKKNLANSSQLSHKEQNEELRKYSFIQPFLQKERSLLEVCKEHHLSLRTARRWVAAVQAGIPLNMVQKWLGHAQLTMLIIADYGHVLDQRGLTMLPHISSIGWDNIILYGEYVLDKSLIK